MENFWFAFGLTVLAGLSTGIGSAIAFMTRKANATLLSIALGFSAGVMIYISFVEMIPESHSLLTHSFMPNTAWWITLVAFFGGVLLTAIIDMSIPSPENPHELHQNKKDLEALKENRHNPAKLLRVGIMTAAVLALHNLPEGMATMMSGLYNPTVALSIALAVAIHNIPEGIAVSVPIYYATGSRAKAFWYSFLSGVSEPVGALLGYLILRPFLSDTLFGVIFAGIAGIMVYISFDELLPAAKEYGKHHHAMIGLFSGMAMMAVSLVLLV